MSTRHDLNHAEEGNGVVSRPRKGMLMVLWHAPMNFGSVCYAPWPKSLHFSSAHCNFVVQGLVVWFAPSSRKDPHHVTTLLKSHGSLNYHLVYYFEGESNNESQSSPMLVSHVSICTCFIAT